MAVIRNDKKFFLMTDLGLFVANNHKGQKASLDAFCPDIWVILYSVSRGCRRRSVADRGIG